MYRLNLLGPVRLVTSDDLPVSGLMTRPKQLAVLAYLATARPRGLHRRDTVIGVFWPEKSQDRARRSLRQTLHVLRSNLGSETVLSRGRDEIGVDLGRVRSDVADVEVAVDRGEVETALSLYRGDFLQGFFLARTPDFEDWVAIERERIRQQVFELTSRAIQGLLQAGDPPGALSIASRVAALRPAHEPSARAVIRLCLEIGDRTRARRAYDLLARQLEVSFGVPPDHETRDLLDRMKQPARIAAPAPSEHTAPTRAGNEDLLATPVPGVRRSRGDLAAPSVPGARSRWNRWLAWVAAASTAVITTAFVGFRATRVAPSPSVDWGAMAAGALVERSTELTGPPPRTSRDAATLLNEAVYLDPAHPQAHALLSLEYTWQAQVGGGDPILADSAEFLARRAVDLASDDALSWLSLAQALGLKGRLGEAQAAYQAGLGRDPRHAELHFGSGWYAFLRGELDRSLRSFGLALAAEPDDALTAGHVGAVLLLAGHPTEAQAWVEAAAAVGTQQPAIFALKVAIYSASDRMERGREALDEWLRSQPDNASAFAVGSTLRGSRTRLGAGGGARGRRPICSGPNCAAPSGSPIGRPMGMP